jgi:multiple sugar transport system substrate-binding protein
MLKSKRFVASALTAAMVMGTLAGCGSSTKGNADTGAAKTEGEKAETSGTAARGSAAVGTKVEFWNDKFANSEKSDVDKIMNSITELSGIKVEQIAYPDTAAYQTAMQQSIRDKKAPGLFTWWSGPQLETLAKNDLLEDLSDLWDEVIVPNGVSKDLADAFTVDGKVYAVPYSVIYNTMVYNMDIFKQFNLEVPQTFDEFITVCQTLKDNGITPIALKNDSWAGFIWFQALIGAYEPQLYLDICNGTKDYTDPDVVKVMNIWKDMLDKGYFTMPMKIQDMDKSLAQGTVAMELEPNYEVGSLIKEYGMVAGENVGVFVLPSMNGHKKVIFYEVTPLCVAKASADKETAKEVLRSWFKKEHQTVLTEVANFVNTSEVQVDNKCIQDTLAFTSDSDNYQMILRYYENTPEEIRNVALDELMKFELGDAGVDEVLHTIQAKASEVFGK